MLYELKKSRHLSQKIHKKGTFGTTHRCLQCPFHDFSVGKWADEVYPIPQVLIIASSENKLT